MCAPLKIVGAPFHTGLRYFLKNYLATLVGPCSRFRWAIIGVYFVWCQIKLQIQLERRNMSLGEDIAFELFHMEMVDALCTCDGNETSVSTYSYGTR